MTVTIDIDKASARRTSPRSSTRTARPCAASCAPSTPTRSPVRVAARGIGPKKLPALRKEFDVWTKAETERKAKIAADSKVKDNSKRLRQ
jgi:hypothetical protein